METPVLEFLPLHSTRLPVLRGVISETGYDDLVSLADRHVLISEISDPNYHRCHTLDLLESDLDDSPDERVRSIYGAMKDTYPREKMDLFIHSDCTRIEEKLKHIIGFALNDISRTGELEVRFSTEAELSFQMIIMDLLSHHFLILNETVGPMIFRFRITMRKESDENETP